MDELPTLIPTTELCCRNCCIGMVLPDAYSPITTGTLGNFSPECALASSIPLRVSFVNLQKIHFPRVRRQPEHINIGAGAKNAVLRAGDDHRMNLGMFKSNAL